MSQSTQFLAFLTIINLKVDIKSLKKSQTPGVSERRTVKKKQHNKSDTTIDNLRNGKADTSPQIDLNINTDDKDQCPLQKLFERNEIISFHEMRDDLTCQDIIICFILNVIKSRKHSRKF